MTGAFGNAGYVAFAVFALGAAALVAALPSRPTPDLPAAPFVGCYGTSDDRLIVSAQAVTIARTGQRTPVERFAFLKDGPVVTTANEIVLGADGRGLSIGAGSTGYFSRFEGPAARASALDIVDEGGERRRLKRVAC